MTHDVNKGKGMAMKTGMEYVYDETDDDGMIFVDADGQHKKEDIEKVIAVFEENKYSLVIGSRCFKGKIPWNKGKHHSDEVKLKMSKKVICVTTGRIFNSQTYASNYYNVAQCSISKCCIGICKSAGKLPNGTKLQWKFLEDYDNAFKGILINPNN